MLSHLKRIGLFILLFISVSAVTGQDMWESVLKRRSSSEEEQYEKWLKAGNLHLKPMVWVKHTDSITKQESFSSNISNKKELIFYIPDTFQQTEKNGSHYIKAYLYNFTDTIVNLQRFDDVLGFVEYYFKFNNEWVKGKPFTISACGNGLWTQQLLPNHYVYLHIENDHLVKGDKTMPLKLVLHINEQVQLEPRTINVQLFGNQIKSLMNSEK